MPHIQHLSAIGLVLVEAGIFGWLSESWVVAGLAILGSIATWFFDWRIPLKPSQRFIAALGVAVPFTIQWAFAPYEPGHLPVFILYSLAHAGGQYGLALQTCYLWVHKPRDDWSSGFPLCGVCVLMAAADVQTTAWQNQIFQVAVLAFTILTAVYFSNSRQVLPAGVHSSSRRRLTWSVATLVITSVLAVSVSVWLERSWTTIERLYTKYMMGNNQGSAAGFSRNARLGDVINESSAHDSLPALRIYSQDEPGYLRGAVMTRYENNSWSSEPTRTLHQPARDTPAGLHSPADRALFRVSPNHTGNGIKQPSSRWATMEVWPVAAVGEDAIFTQLQTEWLAVPQLELIVDEHGIAYPDGVTPDTSYHCYRPVSGPDNLDDIGAISPLGDLTGVDPPVVNVAALTQLPENLDPRIRDVASRVFRDCPTPESKVLAVSRWFRKNYHYALGLRIPTGHDPLTWFLTRQPPAHCEYFASGTVILLRLSGIPCRYVTGFVVDEYNYFGGYWLARNKNAHAWVEAWLPGRGWMIVESTPAEGVPHASQALKVSHFWDDLLMRVQMLRNQLSAGTLSGYLGAMRTIIRMFLTTPHGWLMLSGLVVWAVVLWRRHVHFTFRRRYDPISAEFHQLLSELERPLERLHIVRGPAETLTQFARRLREHPEPAVQATADWYSDYCTIRYQNDSIPKEIGRLRDALPQLLKGLKERLAKRK